MQIKSAKVKKIGKGAFTTCKEGMTVKVPAKKLKKYKGLLNKSKLPKKAKVTK